MSATEPSESGVEVVTEHESASRQPSRHGGRTPALLALLLSVQRTTEAAPTPAVDQNRVIATMTHVDGRWLISGLKAY